MASQVVTRYLYRHPRTRRLISQAKAKLYNRRAKKKIKPEVWLYVIRKFSPAELKQSPRLKRLQGRIEQAVRLTKVEKILKLSSFSDRHIRKTLGKHKTFKALWENWGGEIRITVSGVVNGKRIKHVQHLAFHRGHWKAASTEPYEDFKDWLVGAILSNLRKRGLRLSNPRESQGRIESLRSKLLGLSQYMEFAKKEKHGAITEQIKWTGKAIQQQKNSRQLTHATIRIEKLA